LTERIRKESDDPAGFFGDRLLVSRPILRILQEAHVLPLTFHVPTSQNHG